MSGRFFAPAFFVSLMILYNQCHDKYLQYQHFIIIILLAALLVQNNYLNIGHSKNHYNAGAGKIVDERLFFSASPRVWQLLDKEKHSTYTRFFTDKAKKYVRYARHPTNSNHPTQPYLYRANIGANGYYVAHDMVVIDAAALAEPLLARLPINQNKRWRIGHFKRTILNRNAFANARVFHKPMRLPRGINRYYTHLWRIVHGPIWDIKRLKSLVGMQLGQYDHYRDSFVRKKYKH